MTLPDIKVRLTADNSGFNRGVGGARKAVGDFQSRADSTARSLALFGDRMNRLGRKLSVASAGIVVAAGGLFALASSSAAAGNKIDKGSTAAGLSAEDYQELAFAIGQVSEVSDEQFGKAMQRLVRSMGEAADGMAAPLDAFEKLGISQEELQSGALTTEEVFNRMSTALQNTASPAEAAAIAAQLLGREGAALGNIMRESGDEIDGLRQRARDLGIIMSDEGVKASAEFTDKMDELKRQLRAVKDQVAVALMPVLTNRLIPAIQDKVIPAMVTLAEKLATAIEWFGNLPEPVREAAGIIAAAIGVGGPVLIAVGAMGTALAGLVAVGGPIALLAAAATALTVAWKLWGDDITAAVGAATDFVVEKFNAMLEFITTFPDRMIELGRNIVDGLKAGIVERWEAFREFMYSLLPEVPEWARDILGIRSPSRVFAEIGHQISAGLAQGIADSQAMVNQAISNLADGAVTATEGMTDGVLSSLAELFRGSKKFAIAETIVSTAQGVANALKSIPFPANLAAAAAVAAKGMAALSTIRSAQPGSANTGALGASGASGAAAPAPRPLQATLNLTGPLANLFAPQIGDLLDQLNAEAGDRGYQLYARASA